ncbi:MAG: hypothetical protein ACI85I_002844 [Arenicella sp.]|jgi:hypothetical protein
MDRSNKFNYSSFVKRLGDVLINFLVNSFAVLGSIYVLEYCFAYQAILPQFGYFTIWLAIYTYLLVSGGVTPGSIIFGSRVVDKEGKYLSIPQAFFRNFAFFITMILHSAMLWRTLNQMPISHSVEGLHEIVYSYQEFSPFLFQLTIGIQIFIVFDLMSVLFNGQNRALRDVMADSFVIERRNYQRITVDRTRVSGFRQKTKEEKERIEEKSRTFSILNQVMEVTEIMNLVKKGKLNNEIVSVKFVSIPKQGQGFYQFLIKHNNTPIFHIKVALETNKATKGKILLKNEQEEWMPLPKWRRRLMTQKVKGKVTGNRSLAMAS